MNTFLTGKKILVTRPAEQNANLCQLIQAAGGKPIVYPVIAIQPITDNPPLDAEKIPQLDFIIFVSVNAVKYGLPYLLDYQTLFKGQYIAIGEKTGEQLRQHNLPLLTVPPPHNSETLLNLADFQPETLTGKNFLIIRGIGGRTLLAETLQSRGAQVSHWPVYRRTLPASGDNTLAEMQLDAVIVTSGEGVENLFALFSCQDWLLKTPLVLISQRVADLARQYSQASLWVAPYASDEGLMIALKKGFTAYEF